MRRRWIGYLVLGAALGLALWPQSRVMAAAVLVVLTVLAVELRAVRRAHRELAGRHRDLALAAAQLALASLRSAGPHDAGGATVPAPLVPLAVAALVERGDVLDALALWRTQAPMAEVDIWTRRRLWRGLQTRGYLREALAVADSCLTEHRDRRTRAVRDRLAAEILVLSGQARPSVHDAPPVGFTPVPGRVLHVVGTSVPVTEAGYTIRTHYTALAQRAAGLDPHVVTQMGYGTDRFRASRDVVDGVPYHRIPGPPRTLLPLDRWLDAQVQRVGGLVAELRPAVLHAASDYVNAVTARAVGDAFHLPVVYESRGFWEETWLSRQAQTYAWNLADLAGTHGLPDVYTLRRALEDRCRREADWVVTLAEVMAERIAGGGVARERISVVPNGVDVDAFPVQTRNQPLAAGLGIADGVTVIGYVSSIVEYEGIDVLIAAYAKVKAAGRAR